MRVLALSNILDLSVYDGKAGTSLIMYTTFERVSQNDRQMDGWTDRQIYRQTDIQTDRYIGICAGLHMP